MFTFSKNCYLFLCFLLSICRTLGVEWGRNSDEEGAKTLHFRASKATKGQCDDGTLFYLLDDVLRLIIIGGD